MSNFYVIIVALADDDNRIALKPLPEFEDCQGDYINACYVDVRNATYQQAITQLINNSQYPAYILHSYHNTHAQTHPILGLFYS